MKRFISAIALFCLVQTLPAITINQWPYTCDFEGQNPSAAWTFEAQNDHYTSVGNHWTIGTLPNDPTNHVLFLTSDDRKAQYATNPDDISRSNAYAVLPLENLPAGTYHISYDYMVGGHQDRHYLCTNFSEYWWTSAWDYDYDTNWGGNEYDRMGTYQYLFGVPNWTHCEFNATVSDQATGHLVFVWHMRENDTVRTNLSAVIDNIEIRPLGSLDCAAQPILLNHHRDVNDAVFRWSGYASEYEVEYFLMDSTDAYYTQTNITGHEYRVDCAAVPEGAYTFRVRSICGNDTSAWSKLSPVLLYDISKHCMDYLDLDNEDVAANDGYFWCPTCGNQKVDYGYFARSSRHTVHFVPGDFDERTGYKLRTFPQGHPAAVRLGNWDAGAQAEAITYTMTITEDMKVMKLWYALVMQLPGHVEQEQPRFTLEILDSVGNYFDEHCGVVDFTASANLQGWHTERSHKMNDTTSVIWKDWTLIGINLRDYVGQTIQIRLSTKDCANTEHFGYAYFALECSRGDMEGIHCGEKPDHFTVEEGFNYRWYHKYDPNHTVIGTDRTYQLTNSLDTATYCVDMIQLLDSSCYFTLEASSLGYIPNAKAVSKWAPVNCQNYIQMVDSSSTQGVYWTAGGQKVIVTETDGAESYLWDFGVYGTSTERNPRLAIPDEGDTVHITLHAMMENGLCDDVLSWDMIVPATGLQQQIETHYICEGSSVEVHGVTYTEEGYYTLDSLTSWTGCDSVYTVAILYFTQDTIHYYDTVCPSELPLSWRGLSINAAGDYTVRIPSINYECDSVKDMLHLYVRPELKVELLNLTQEVCSETGKMEIPFHLQSGDISAYAVYFDSLAIACGLHNIAPQPLAEGASDIVLDMPEGMWPGLFTGSIRVWNYDCDSLLVPFSFDVRYTADSIITQRWGDFLSVRTSAFNRYGGFSDYQWYKDGQLMSGQTGSQLYLPDEGLDMQSGYSVELTRTADGVRVRTCDFYPQPEPGTVTLAVVPSLVRAAAQQPLRVESSAAGQLYVFDQSGMRVDEMRVEEGPAEIDCPRVAGLYLVVIAADNGRKTTAKFIVE